jgi:maltose O-acetyltransferase
VSLLDLAWGWISRLRARLERVRVDRRWQQLRSLGMRIGDDVLLPGSTWIDPDFCHLIEIGDHTGFGEGCVLLAHDAQMDEFLDAARVGRIVIRESCHIGTRSILLPGIELGPRTLVGAGSVVSRSLPANSVCAGAPARVICSLDEYLERHRKQIAERPTFSYETHGSPFDPTARAELQHAVADGVAYIAGGRSAELRGEGGSLRTRAPARKS